MVIHSNRYLVDECAKAQKKINWRYTLAEMGVSNEIDTIVLPEKGVLA